MKLLENRKNTLTSPIPTYRVAGHPFAASAIPPIAERNHASLVDEAGVQISEHIISYAVCDRRMETNSIRSIRFAIYSRRRSNSRRSHARFRSDIL
jgi:hypothetical protein